MGVIWTASAALSWPKGSRVCHHDLQSCTRDASALKRLSMTPVTFEVDTWTFDRQLSTIGGFYALFLDRAMASRASRSAVRRRSVSRLSHICLPLASASSTLTRPFLKYIRVGIKVRPRC
jgi:hypothetical protein